MGLRQYLPPELLLRVQAVHLGKVPSRARKNLSLPPSSHAPFFPEVITSPTGQFQLAHGCSTRDDIPPLPTLPGKAMAMHLSGAGQRVLVEMLGAASSTRETY